MSLKCLYKIELLIFEKMLIQIVGFIVEVMINPDIITLFETVESLICGGMGHAF